MPLWQHCIALNCRPARLAAVQRLHLVPPAKFSHPPSSQRSCILSAVAPASQSDTTRQFFPPLPKGATRADSMRAAIKFR